MTTLRKILKRLTSPFLQFVAKKYTNVPHEYRFGQIEMTILPSVFHPAFYISTKCLIDFLAKKELRDKKLWELGAGSGLVSLFAAQKGAIVTATDINPAALKGLKMNSLRNNLALEVIESDIFANIQHRFFEYIVINPPYYPQNPQNDAEKAFFCGAEFGYFHRFFQGLNEYFQVCPQQTEVIMILSEDCRLAEIENIANQHSLCLCKVWEKKVWGEQNFIFQIQSVN